MLNVQKSLDYFIHSAIYESQGQVTECVVGEALLEGANQKNKQIHSNLHDHKTCSDWVHSFQVIVCQHLVIYYNNIVVIQNTEQ